MDLVKIIFLAIVTNNIVLNLYIGSRPMLGEVREISSALHVGISVLIITFFTNIFSFILYEYILIPHQIQLLQTFAFIIIIILVLALYRTVTGRFNKTNPKKSTEYMTQISSSSVVLGICLLAFSDGNFSSLTHFIIYSLSASGGYLLALIIITGISEQMRLSTIPKGMKGIPISLITLGILAMAFMGLTGIFK